MSSAMRSQTQVVVEQKIVEFDRRFANSFEEASERRLMVLYDEVAPKLGEQFEQLASAGEGQVEVLKGVAKLVGLEDIDFNKPLAREASEALAQRIAWRSTARWAVLSLLWALVERRPEAMAPGDWTTSSKEPRSPSLLESVDEPMALDLAATSLTSSLAATNGCGMVVLDLPVVIGLTNVGRVAAEAVRPVALVETSSDPSANPLELLAGDRIWLAGSDPAFFSVEAEYDSTDSLFEIRSEGWLRLDEQTRAIGVVKGITLLYEGKSLEESP